MAFDAGVPKPRSRRSAVFDPDDAAVTSASGGVAPVSETISSSALANGIWEALVCTAVGLVIAILFTALHAMLQTRLERVSEETSNLLTRVLTLGVGRG